MYYPAFLPTEDKTLGVVRVLRVPSFRAHQGPSLPCLFSRVQGYAVHLCHSVAFMNIGLICAFMSSPSHYRFVFVFKFSLFIKDIITLIICKDYSQLKS